jgi:hypothetical protein
LLAACCAMLIAQAARPPWMLNHLWFLLPLAPALIAIPLVRRWFVREL